MNRYIYHVFIISLLCCISFIQSFAQQNISSPPLGAQNIDGGVDGTRHGVAYTVIYDTTVGNSMISPRDSGETSSGDVGVDISGSSNENIVIEMNLPDHLIGTGGTSMAISFPSSGPGSGVRREDRVFFNPNVTNTFSTGPGGIIGLRLGYVYTIPTNTNVYGDSYIGQILINAYETSSTGKVLRQVSIVVTITINVSASWIGVSGIDGKVDSTFRGITYTVIYDAYGGQSTITPQDRGENVSDIGVNILGEPTSNVVVEFSLPDHLIGTGSNSMIITFPTSGPGSGVRTETGGFFNPNAVNTFNLGEAGTCSLRLGYVFTVPANIGSDPEVFSGEITVNAYYTGLYSKKIRQISTIFKLTIKVNTSKLNLEESNGGYDVTYSGTTYSVSFDPYADQSTILPLNSFAASTGDVGINITGRPSANVIVNSELPDTLIGSLGTKIPITFPSSGPGSGVRVETGGYFNSNVSNTFNLGGAGICKLRLGYTFTIPQGTNDSEVFSGNIISHAYYRDLSNQKSTFINPVISTITIKSSRLIWDKINGEVNGAHAGIQYTVRFDNDSGKSFLIPNNYGETHFGDVGINIFGETTSNIIVEIELPDTLIGSAGTEMPISFPASGPTSGVRIENGAFFNPNVTNLFSTGFSGYCRLRLGYVFTIPVSTLTTESFQGNIHFRVHYISLSKSISNNVFNVRIDSAIATISINTQPLAVRNQDGGIPMTTSLIQNYPNPFNPSTNIEFQIKEYGIVTLKIYDMLGKEVAIIVNEKLSPGSYSKTWNASDFPSGVYYYKLQTENFSEVKKLLLVR